jgi:hypothetical protein
MTNEKSKEIYELMVDEWVSGLEGIEIKSIRAALEICKKELEWPPNVAEFRKLCERASGLPDLSEALALALRRDFKHPVVKLAFDRIGSWDFSHDTEKELKKKFKHAYEESLRDFRNGEVKFLPSKSSST